jgi:hypothetical protein
VDTVALVATVGGSAVALASIGGNVLIAKAQRRQAVELAQSQHLHERELARGDRLYNRRAPVYEAMMGIVQPVMEHVEARNPIITFTPSPSLPEEPSVADQRAMQIELRTHGSPEVSAAFHDFVMKVRRFQIEATTFETVHASTAQLSGERQRMNAARDEARAAADELERLVADELASF